MKKWLTVTFLFFSITFVSAVASPHDAAQAASYDQIFIKKNVPYTHDKVIWETQTHYGIVYSGYLYNRGFSDAAGRYSLFSGYLIGSSMMPPIVPMTIKLPQASQ